MESGKNGRIEFTKLRKLINWGNLLLAYQYKLFWWLLAS